MFMYNVARQSWHALVIPGLKRQKQEDQTFQASLCIQREPVKTHGILGSFNRINKSIFPFIPSAMNMILIKYTLYNSIVFQNVVLVGFQKLQFLFLFM